MSIILREGDKTDLSEGYGLSTFQPGTSTGTASNVLINGIGVVCAGDVALIHCDDDNCHVPIAGNAGARVFVGPSKKPISTIDTPLVGCGDGIAPVVGTVLAG